MVTMPRSIIVVEDDAAIARNLIDALSDNDFVVSWCVDGATAMSSLESADRPDLVLLDAGLPDLDGLMLCRWIRDLHPELPIIFVTARDAEIDIVVGLDAGANDYVTKPFSMAVLLARIRAQLRSGDGDGPLVVGALRIDRASRKTWLGDDEVTLRRLEFDLLALLASQAGRVVSRNAILSEVWDVHWDSQSRTLDMHLVALRRKLSWGVTIETVRGVGYRLVAP
jgi:DNA-binding response OmpR family regulator